MTLEKLGNTIAKTLALKPTIGIEITTSSGCNCNCAYCFETSHQFTRDIEEENRQLALLEEYCSKDFSLRNINDIRITFWGGEPMMNLDYVKKIIEATIKYDFVRYYMYTNGTLLDAFKDLAKCKWADELKKRIHIQLSYDGEPHNTIKRGEFSSKMVIKTAEFLKNAGFEVSFKATLSFDMLSKLPEIWKSYLDLREKLGAFVQYAPTLDMTTSDQTALDEWRNGLKEVMKLEYDLWKKTKGLPLLAHLSSMTHKRVCDMRGTVLMHNDGNFYLCHGCAYLDDSKKKNLVLGNTKDNSIAEVLSKTQGVKFDEKNKDCQRCPATWCTTCHAMSVDPANYQDDWIKCISSDKVRCKFFKIFATLARAFQASKFCWQ